MTKELFTNQEALEPPRIGAVASLVATEETAMKYRSTGAVLLAVALAASSPALARGGHGGGGHGGHGGGHFHGAHAGGFHRGGEHGMHVDMSMSVETASILKVSAR